MVATKALISPTKARLVVMGHMQSFLELWHDQHMEYNSARRGGEDEESWTSRQVAEIIHSTRHICEDLLLALGPRTVMMGPEDVSCALAHQIKTHSIEQSNFHRHQCAMALEIEKSYARRLTVVKNLMEELNLEAAKIVSLQWTANQLWPYNNFNYKVTLSRPASKEQLRAEQPCTVSPPADGLSSVIVRLSNPRAPGLNNTNRIQNEVAALHLARGAVTQLSSRHAAVVPAVYAWKAFSGPELLDETRFGWIVMECLPGTPLGPRFESFDMAQKREILREMAVIFTALQGTKLPPGANRFGGLTIDDGGNIVSGQGTLQAAHDGPWQEYDQVWSHHLLALLNTASGGGGESMQDSSVHNLHERIQRFSRETLRGVLNAAGVDMSELGFVHTEFTMDNMLYDPQEKRITGILDFEWAAVTNPAKEFLFASLQDVYGDIKDQESEKLGRAILSGDFSASEDDSEGEYAEEWELAETWSEAVRECGGLEPSNIRGMDTLVELSNFLRKVCSWRLIEAGLTRATNSEQNAMARQDAEKAVDDALRGWGV